MKQLTVRGFDAALERKLRELARTEDISLNRAALRLMRRGAGLEEGSADSRVVGASLDHLFGTWSEEEARELDDAVAVFEDIDAEMWA